MSSVGFSFAGAQDAMAQQVRQRIMDELSQKQTEFNNALALRGADRADRSLSQQDELTRLKIKELADNKAASEADQQFRIGTTLNNSIPAGTILPPESPAVKLLQGVGALREQAPTLPSTSYIGAQMTAPQPENPNASIQGTLRMQSNAGNSRQFVKLPSQAEQTQASTASDRQSMNEARIQSLQSAADNAVQRANMAGATAEAKATAAAAQLELQRERLKMQQDAAGAKQDEWTQVQGAQQVTLPDGTKGYPFANKRGEVKIVPIGGTPEKVAPGGLISDVRHYLFGGESAPKQIRYDTNGKPIS